MFIGEYQHAGRQGRLAVPRSQVELGAGRVTRTVTAYSYTQAWLNAYLNSPARANTRALR
jgi:hypothetical protein